MPLKWTFSLCTRKKITLVLTNILEEHYFAQDELISKVIREFAMLINL